MVQHCVASGYGNSSQSGFSVFWFPKIHSFVKVGRNKFDEQETAEKVQQSTMEFAAVTSKNTFAISLQHTHSCAVLMILQ